MKIVYVDSLKGQDEGNNGTLESPFKTVFKAMNYLSSNELFRENSAIIFREGVYDISKCLRGHSNNFNKQYKNMKVSWIAEAGEEGKVIISSDCGFEVQLVEINKNYKIKISFYGLVFRNIPLKGVVLNGDDWTNEYYNCVFDNVGVGGWSALYKDSKAIVKNCLFVNTKERDGKWPIAGECINSASTNSHIQPIKGKMENVLLNCKVDDNYNLIGENKGDIGVYAGEFAWQKLEKNKCEFIINNTPLYFNKYVYVDALAGSDEEGTGEFNSPFKSVKKSMDFLNSKNFYRENCAIIFKKGSYEISNCLFGKENNLNPKYNGMNVSWICDIFKQGTVFINSKKGFKDIFSERNRDYKIKMNFYGLVFKDIKGKGITLSGKHLFNNFYNCVFDNIFVAGEKDIPKDSMAVIENCLFINIKNKEKEFKTFGKCINSASTNDYIKAINGEKKAVLYNCKVDDRYNILQGDWRNKGLGENTDGSKCNIGVYGGKFAWSNGK